MKTAPNVSAEVGKFPGKGQREKFGSCHWHSTIEIASGKELLGRCIGKVTPITEREKRTTPIHLLFPEMEFGGGMTLTCESQNLKFQDMSFICRKFAGAASRSFDWSYTCNVLAVSFMYFDCFCGGTPPRLQLL